MAEKEKSNQQEILGFLGVGLDNKDEHQRLTRTEDFLLVGGSEETHEQMQDAAIYFARALKKRGKRLKDTSKDEAIDLLKEALDQ